MGAVAKSELEKDEGEKKTKLQDCTTTFKNSQSTSPLLASDCVWIEDFFLSSLERQPSESFG